MTATLDRSNDTAEMIAFRCHAAQAATVCLIGDFNDWNATTHPMRREADGSWFLQVPLARGRHYYQFQVDGKPVLDPQAMYFTFGERHEKVSFIALS
jgi:1,4-alpha-glucan branching enzyme